LKAFPVSRALIRSILGRYTESCGKVKSEQKDCSDEKMHGSKLFNIALTISP
jgi:hypothetical protein